MLEQSKQFTPTRMVKKPHAYSSASLPKTALEGNKSYLPSRFINEKAPKNQPQDILHSVEVLAKTNDLNGKLIKTPSQQAKRNLEPKVVLDSLNKKNTEITEFKAKPLKRYQSDYLNFKQIFVQPRQQVLKKITRTDKSMDLSTSKILKPNSTVMEDIAPEKTDLKQYFDVAIQFLDTKVKDPSEVFNSDGGSNFYEEQIKIQPPDLPNSSVASTLTPGNGYAPSIPLTYMMKENKNNLKDLLVRAKAGIYAEDVQKEAHLSFFLGMVYETRLEYQLAVKFYRRFLGFAKTMEDKIGMALGANRVAINEYYCGNVAKSITYHQENLKLSDAENTFAGFYNIGVCYRKLEKYSEAIEYFQNALQWALQRDEIEEYSITYGQLGVTYMRMQLYEEALQNLQKSLQLCRRLKKTQIQLDNLLYIIKISQRFNLKSQHNTDAILQETLHCCETLENKKLYNLTVCNLGISKGKELFEEFRQKEENRLKRDQEWI